MKLLELYEKLCTGEIKLSFPELPKAGVCAALSRYIDYYTFSEFYNLFQFSGKFLPNAGKMTPERETFLLLFAAYKGEL